MRQFACILAVLLVCAPATARADEPVAPPRRWVPFVATGATLSGLGAANMATAPICATALVSSSLRAACWATSLGVGGAMLAAGVPLLVVGLRARQSVTIAPTVGGFVVSGSWGGAS